MANQQAAKKDGETREKKVRKPRASKPLDSKGILKEFANKLTATEADYFMRHFVKPHFKGIETVSEPIGLEAEIKQAIKAKLEAPTAAASTES